MTTPNDTAQIPVRLDFDSLAAGYSRAMSHLDHAATKELDKAETRLSETHVPEPAYQDVAAEFSPLQVAALVSLIVTINAWNAIGVSTRAWAPGSYNP